MPHRSAATTPLFALLLLGFAVGASFGATSYYVAQSAPGAADQNPGTEKAPFKTIGAAMKLVKPGDTVLVGRGTYREEVVWKGEDWKNPQVRTTLAASPGTRPVIKGSDVVTAAWTKAEVKLTTAPAAAPPSAGTAPIYSCPWERYSQMVFVDEQPLQQIGLQGSPARAKGNNGFQFTKQWDGKSVADLRPGSFYMDGEAKRLYVWLADGSNPARHTIEASVRATGVSVNGTWTVRGLDVRQFQDHFWPYEQAVAINGNQSIAEDCHITHNELLGLIMSGEDCIVRNNEIAYNGLMGLTSNVGYRTLVEGNEFHHDCWRGDVVCLTLGNKMVYWRDARFLRNRWHDEPGCALWFDISNGNILVAENTFDNCSCGIYYEISRWGKIVNNVFRNCGRAIWIYGADVLVAHNILDSCGEGITVTNGPRGANWGQSSAENSPADCLMAVRNVQVVNNILIDCVGSFIGIDRGCPYGWGNWSDYNAIVWTLKPFHPTGLHLNFMNGWDQLYGKLPIWRTERHCDLHSVVADPGLLREIRSGSPWVGLSEQEVFADAKFVDRANGDYRLAKDSPLIGKGLTLPMELNSYVLPCDGGKVLTREWGATRMTDAPDPKSAVPVFGKTPGGYYRLQPLPKLHALVDPGKCEPGTPGLNVQWRETGKYPEFKATGEADTATPTDFVVLPTNLLADAGFDKPVGQPGEAGPWIGVGGTHTFTGTLCANMLANQRTNALAYQKVGTVRANAEYVLCVDHAANSTSKTLGGVAGMYLAAGDPTKPMGAIREVHCQPGRGGSWGTYDLQVRTGAQGADANVGQNLYVVIFARVEGPEGPGADAVFFPRWDDVWLLSSPPEAGK